MPEIMEENSAPAPSRKEQMKAMSLIEHLEELRRRILWSVVWIGLGFFFCWGFAQQIYVYVQKPMLEEVKNNNMEQTLVVTSPTEAFNLYLKVGLVAGIFAASPLVLYQVWLFISPGLYRNEKRYIVPFMFSAVTLFLSGGFFFYKMGFSHTLDFLIRFGKQFKPLVSPPQYTNLFLAIHLCLGI